MKALILAAGLGTRLKPITDTRPKALAETEGKTLLEHALCHLKSNGILEAIINVHHFPGMIIDFLKDHDNFGMEITISDETGELLETGGALKKVSWYFNDGLPFLVRNVDILSDLDLSAMAESHHAAKALATLAVRNRVTSRYFLFDGQMWLSGWENQGTGVRKITRHSGILSPLAFSGIQMVNPAVFPLITESGKFSLTSLYLRLSEHYLISGYLEMNSYWHDAGKNLDA